MNKLRTATTLTTLGLVAVMMAGCASAAASSPDASAEAGASVDELRLGYFANVTHAPALVGLEEGLFEDALGDVEVTTQVFNAGPAAIEALSAGAIDATYIGPNPSINTFIQSGGESAHIIAGAATGGAALVVREGIDDPADLAGTTLASPQLGNTQDVSLRTWLADEGFETDTSGGGDVSITPTENAQTLTLFQQGTIDGAWLPEPWVSRLIDEAGAHVLIDEAELWEDGEFPTTVLLVRAEFLEEHPDVVEDLLEGHVAAVQWIADNPDEAGGVINGAIEAETGKPLADAVIARALEHVTFSVDPHADTFETLVGERTGGRDAEGRIDRRPLRPAAAQRHPRVGRRRHRLGGRTRRGLNMTTPSAPTGARASDRWGAPPHTPGSLTRPPRPLARRTCSARASTRARPFVPRRLRPRRPCASRGSRSASAPGRSCSMGSTSRSHRESSSASSAHPGAASPRCSTSSRDSTSRRPATSTPRARARRSCSRSRRSCRG